MGIFGLGFGEAGYYKCPNRLISRGFFMKKLLPLERISSVGRVHKLAAIVVAASVSCLPLAALADHTSGGHGGGGGHPSGGGHPAGGGHPSVGGHPAGGGNHSGS